MLYHTAPGGIVATVLANGSLSSNTSGEGEIRKRLIEADLVECIVALPKQLFYNTGIPACIWFLRRERTERRGEILFIDASEMGYMKDRVHREFTDEDMDKISSTYHNWRNAPQPPEGGVQKSHLGDLKVYEDTKGFCKSAKLADIEKHGYVLTPGRYVGITDVIDDGIPFEDKMRELTAKLSEQMKKEKELDEEIKKQLAKIGFEI